MGDSTNRQAHHMNRTSLLRGIGWLALLTLFVSACSSGGGDSTSPPPPPPPPSQVSTPDVVGVTQATAESRITGAGLVVGTVSQEASNTVPAGDVISQDPTAGTDVNSGSSVSLVISTGPADVAVPNVVGLSEAAAIAALNAAGLTVGDVSDGNSDTVPVGDVISQDPASGTLVSPASAVDIVVSLGPGTNAVPDVVGQTEAAAAAAITGAGLVVGTIDRVTSNTVPAGSVISQDPVAGTLLSPGLPVDLVVSLGPPIAVPDVTGQLQAAAEAAITGAGLALGMVTTQNDPVVPVDNVISQNPAAGTLVDPGSSVDLVVSLGPGTIAVPDVVGLTQAAAEAAITGAGLTVGTVAQATSDTVPAGNVISQDPVGGTLVSAGIPVNLVVSLGPAVTVPNVTGQPEATAATIIVNAGLVVGNVVQQNSPTVPVGNVISQSPVGGTEVDPGSRVDLVVSLGPADVPVPDVVGQTQAAAEAAITGASLTVSNVTQQNSNSVPVGNVISQNPTGGTMVAPGSAVDIVVSLGPATVAVPNVVGLGQAAAESAITGAGLTVGNITQQNSSSVPVGDVISQNPIGGTQVTPGSAVDLVVSLGPAVSTFSDEFDDGTSLSDWSLRHVVESTSQQYTTLDIDTSRAGYLTIIPTQTPGWFGGGTAPLIFKTITGNFAVETRVIADSLSNPGNPPGSNFNSAGLMARDPAGATGPENYIMLNTGRQDNRIPTGVGSETKTTVNSSSTLFLDQGANSGRLILCRVGNTFYSFRFLDDDSDWTATDNFVRNDLPATLQVGMVVNAFAAPPDLRAEFDYIRLRPTPSVVGDCTP